MELLLKNVQEKDMALISLLLDRLGIAIETPTHSTLQKNKHKHGLSHQTEHPYTAAFDEKMKRSIAQIENGEVQELTLDEIWSEN